MTEISLNHQYPPLPPATDGVHEEKIPGSPRVPGSPEWATCLGKFVEELLLDPVNSYFHKHQVDSEYRRGVEPTKGAEETQTQLALQTKTLEKPAFSARNNLKENLLISSVRNMIHDSFSVYHELQEECSDLKRAIKSYARDLPFVDSMISESDGSECIDECSSDDTSRRVRFSSKLSCHPGSEEMDEVLSSSRHREQLWYTDDDYDQFESNYLNDQHSALDSMVKYVKRKACEERRKKTTRQSSKAEKEKPATRSIGVGRKSNTVEKARGTEKTRSYQQQRAEKDEFSGVGRPTEMGRRGGRSITVGLGVRPAQRLAENVAGTATNSRRRAADPERRKSGSIVIRLRPPQKKKERKSRRNADAKRISVVI